MASDDLIELTVQIVASHVASNRINAADVPALISKVHGALSGLGNSVETPVEQAKPAVSVRSSVKPDAITCLECGAKQKMLKRHLATAHDLSTDDYRAKWKLPAEYPLVAPNYAAQRKELAIKSGLGRKAPGKAPAGRKRKSS